MAIIRLGTTRKQEWSRGLEAIQRVTQIFMIFNEPSLT